MENCKGGKSMIKTLQRRFALSKEGAVDLIKGCIACVAQDISFMFPVGLLYYFVIDTMNDGVSENRIVFLCGWRFGLLMPYLYRDLVSI